LPRLAAGAEDLIQLLYNSPGAAHKVAHWFGAPASVS
jgi:hypothetical protein